MVAVRTPEGIGVAIPRDGQRMRFQARHNDVGTVNYKVSVGDSAGLTDGVRGQARHGGAGSVAPHIRLYNDVRWNHDRQRMERRIMYTDSDLDYYKQEWFNLDTGELVWSKEGRLSDPDMHGKSARRSPSPDDERQ